MTSILSFFFPLFCRTQVFNIIPPKVEYSLTEEGKELEKIFYLLGQWGENLAKKNNLENIKCSKPIKL